MQPEPGSLPAPESLVVPSDLLGVLRRDGVAVDRHKGRLRRVAAAELVVHRAPKLGQRQADRHADDVPVRLLRVPVGLGPGGLGPLADAGGLGPQPRVADHLLDVAEPVGPLAEVVAGEHAALAAFVDRGAGLAAAEAAVFPAPATAGAAGLLLITGLARVRVPWPQATTLALAAGLTLPAWLVAGL